MQRRLKIAILVHTFPPFLGGTEIATYNIARYLVKKGNKVDVITFGNNILPEEDVQDGIFIHRINITSGNKILRIYQRVNKISRLLAEIKPDVIHVQMALSTACQAIIINKIILQRLLVVYGRGSDIYFAKTPLRKFKLRFILKHADEVIALTNDMKKEMQKVYNRAVAVIPNGIEIKPIQPTCRSRIRNHLGIANDEKVIISVGVIRPVKGFEYLIRAMNIIIAEMPDTKLVIIGEGPEKEALIKLSERMSLDESILFLGEIPNEKIPDYMSAADIFVLPSLSESFGIVNLEAMSVGLPIVASNVGGVPELVVNGENGFLVEPGNITQIAEKVLYLLADAKLRETISQNNKSKAMSYSWDRTVDLLEEVYRKHREVPLI